MDRTNQPVLSEQVRQMELENSQYDDICNQNFQQTEMIHSLKQSIEDREARITSLIKANDTHVRCRMALKSEIATLKGDLAAERERGVKLSSEFTSVYNQRAVLKGENDVLGAKVAVLERRTSRHIITIRSMVRRNSSLRRSLQAKMQVIMGIKRFLKTAERKS